MADGSSGVTDLGTVVVEADRIVDESPGSGSNEFVAAYEAENSAGGSITDEDDSGDDSGDSGKSSNDQIIPSDARQKLLPFWIAPASAENIGGPQMFTFRQGESHTFNSGKLNIMPDDRSEYDKDLGIRFLVSKYIENSGFGNDATVTMSDILDNIPAIRIREYTQDTKLDLLWGLLKNGIAGFKKGAEVAEEDQKQSLMKTFGLKATQATAFASAMANAIKDSTFWEDLVDNIGDIGNSMKIDPNFYTDSKIKTKLILQLVYALYYRMIGSTTTNIYVLPFIGTDIMNTNGADGWGGPNSWGGSTSVNSIFGKFFNFALGSNVKIVSEPIWGGSSGGGGSGINVTLNLFNDTYDSAMMNFIFVNTIFPQNLFLQYGIFQQPPSVYDVQIEGSRRWFMCTGAFSCKYRGVMRNMNEEFVTQLFKKHGNPYLTNRMDANKFIENRVVKIPDVYEITLNFSSLLPDNFNQYLFQYAMKNSISRDDGTIEKAWYSEGSKIDTFIKDKFKEMKEDAANEAMLEPDVIERIKKAEEIKDNTLGGGEKS